ncbi:uncharacterized protein LOC130700656 isoform X2 [Daphnia carinata]|uniref:uncharacterized protein LOC130700656 isoform X2 n=1 Tax=Daphnia carinata TaxID=120202 RepID=UPI0025803FF6|nr:uncharacterized protein LOC130700656 isoform X2 [Daphnia carinata]
MLHDKRMINQFILICLLVVPRSQTLLSDTADVSGESEESVESTEETILSARSPASGVMQQLAPPTTYNKTKFNNVKNQNSNKIVKPIIHQLQTPAVRPYFYPAVVPPYFLRASPYQAAYYHPVLMPIISPLYPASSTKVRDEILTGRRPFPVDDEISQEEALKELEAIKQEMAEDAAAERHLSRLVLPSISVNGDEASVTVSLKSFASLLRSLSSRVTVTLATRTILVPNVSVNN